MKKAVKVNFGLCIVVAFVLFLLGLLSINGHNRIEAKAITDTFSQNLHHVNLEENGYSNVKYIQNANYFRANPLHHENDGTDNKYGTCTTVAMQMLLGYHNYYSDRRLIPQKSVNGNDFLGIDYEAYYIT